MNPRLAHRALQLSVFLGLTFSGLAHAEPLIATPAAVLTVSPGTSSVPFKLHPTKPTIIHIGRDFKAMRIDTWYRVDAMKDHLIIRVAPRARIRAAAMGGRLKIQTDVYTLTLDLVVTEPDFDRLAWQVEMDTQGLVYSAPAPRRITPHGGWFQRLFVSTNAASQPSAALPTVHRCSKRTSPANYYCVRAVLRRSGRSVLHCSEDRSECDYQRKLMLDHHGRYGFVGLCEPQDRPERRATVAH